MSRKLFLSTAALLVVAGFASAQGQPAWPVVPAAPNPQPPFNLITADAPKAGPAQPAAGMPTPFMGDCTPGCSLIDSCDCSSTCAPKFWVNAEYLLWWVKNGPVDAPLLTFNPSNISGAALTDPGTSVLFGPGSGNGLNYGMFSGLRLTVGGWLAGDVVGWEANGFMLERRPVQFQAFSAGDTALGNPIRLPVPGLGLAAGENAFTNGNGAGIPETAVIQSSSQLWGSEANILLHVFNGERLHVNLLAGFRYLDLEENLRLSESTSDATTGGTQSALDSFQTRNQFYAGQIGSRFEFTSGRLSVEWTTLIAMGPDHETLTINGASTVTNGAFGFPTGTFAGGVYAEPSNIGRFHRDVFTVAPETRLQIGYNLTSRLRATIGYDFLEITDVLRPGDQVDRNVNVNQNGLFGTGTVQAPALPAPLLHGSDFWAQGLTFGLEFHF